MPQNTNNQCSAKNPAVCRNHGWVKRPISSDEAYSNLQKAQSDNHSAVGRTTFLKNEQVMKSAQKIFNRTPQGQERLKDKIDSAKKLGISTVPVKAELAEAKYERALEEGNFHVEGVRQNLFYEAMPPVTSPRGQELVKELFKGSTKTPEALTGKPVVKSEWIELIEARKREVKETAGFRYKKSFDNRLTADLKEYDVSRKKVSGTKNEFQIKKTDGTVIAKLKLRDDGNLEQATVATSSDGRTSTYADGVQFRTWLERNHDKALTLPEWV